MNVAEIMTTDVETIAPDADIDSAIDRMELEDIRHLPVLDGDRLVGVVSERDLLDETGWLPKNVREESSTTRSVRDVMHAPVVSVVQSESVVSACFRLLEWGVGCLPVTEDGKLVGMLSEIDVLDAYCGASGGPFLEVASDPPIGDLMSAELFSTGIDTPLTEVIEFMRSKDVRHLPILDGKQLVGIVSDRDVRMSLARGLAEDTPAVDFMHETPHALDQSEKVSVAAHLFVRYRIGALPVLANKRLVGMLSSVDVLSHCTQALANS